MRFSFHTRESENPDVNTVDAVNTIAELTDVTITKTEHSSSRDGSLVAMDAECEQGDCEQFIQSMRAFGLLY